MQNEGQSHHTDTTLRWIKHLTQARQDDKLAAFIALGGRAGYGAWWLMLEVIAAGIEPGRETCSLTQSQAKWCSDLSMDSTHPSREFAKFAEDLAKVGLCSVQGSVVNGRKVVTITVPNLLKYRDEYSRKSGVSPDKLLTGVRSRAEQIQIENRLSSPTPPFKPPPEDKRTSQITTTDEEIPTIFGELWAEWKKAGPRNLAEQYFCEEIALGTTAAVIAYGLRGWMSWFDATDRSGGWRYCNQNLAAAIHDKTWQTLPPNSDERQPLKAEHRNGDAEVTEWVSADEWKRIYGESAKASS